MISAATMAQSLKLKVIAEGVETGMQLSYLQHHGCNQIQGYYFSRPLPLPELELLLARKKSLPPNMAPAPQKSIA